MSIFVALVALLSLEFPFLCYRAVYFLEYRVPLRPSAPARASFISPHHGFSLVTRFDCAQDEAPVAVSWLHEVF